MTSLGIRSARAMLTVTLVVGLVACGGANSGQGVSPSPNAPGSRQPPINNSPNTPPPPSTKTPDPTPPTTSPPPPVTPPPPGGNTQQPQVTSVTFTSEESREVYRANATNVARDVAVTANVYLPTAGVGVAENSLKGNVRLYEAAATTSLVAGSASTDGAGGNITFTPTEVLKSNTKYTFEVTTGVKDESGKAFAAFKASFTTGTREPQGPLVTFAERTVYSGSPIASVRVGNDGRLYAVTLDGKILRWAIDSDGGLSALQTLAIPELAGRALIGLAHDPRDPNVLWISNNAPIPYAPGQVPPDFSGKVSKVTITDAAAFTGTVQDYVVGLPRSIKDHLTNSLVFGPDGALYVSQGSNSSTGAPDGTWVRSEHRLTATVLRIDPTYDVSGGPIDVQTEKYEGSASLGNYDPNGERAPVTIFADGVRNAYDLVWHTDGALYVPTNGGAAGGNTPAGDGAPALNNVSNQDDYLFRVTGSGGYYGHPVALRGHYVLNGGNPTAGRDPFEVVPDGQGRAGYPEGTRPDANYRPPVHTFGANRSPNGAIEYKSNSFGGALKNRLLVVEYSNGKDVVALKLEGGKVTDVGRIGTTVNGRIKRFQNPLDLAEDGRNGNLYVVELGSSGGRIQLLTPSP
ncbi:Ig-like domain-containing protein [Deinococcus peraridilitoris]|uniref:Glucose/sorbosone dehydrogenase n=1 Tax=Deinococcus peraridilitoris (strain DSM 19664 / LMG 22246 / CIP 109416 / KR-200) TaxID=937777 RepID=L0A6M2_DEIPD|nr:Ig-like domain-containing protein [Deinococcus peraridilitoris]AFZ68660.1 glucose/sorbosone dehydrogenase [Deinococcus peraridilitoris DSM 19664]